MLRIVALALLMLAFTQRSQAQNPDAEALMAALPDTVSHETFIVNGTQVYGLAPEAADSLHELGDFSHLPLTLVALRLVDKGKLDLDRPVAKYLPDILDHNPFEVAVTARHLMTDSAGFAMPPTAYVNWANAEAPLKAYALQVRTAGQAASRDPVGWLILTKLLETVSGKDIATLLQDEILVPAGLTADAIRVRSDIRYQAGANPEMQATGSAIAAIVQLVMRNLDHEGAPYLSPDSHIVLTSRPFWRLHPYAPEHMLGLVGRHEKGVGWLNAGRTDGPGAYMVWFPAAQLAAVYLGGNECSCSHEVLAHAAVRHMAKSLPPEDLSLRKAAADRISPPDTLGGRYVLAEAASAWTFDRLSRLGNSFAGVAFQGDTLGVVQAGATEIDTYHLVSPYYFENDAGEPVVFSPYRQGGYMLYKGKLYRFVGALGDPKLVISPLTWLILILATSILYIRSKTDKAWRFMAVFGFLGTALVCAGLYGEWALWPRVVYADDRAWLVTLWRTGLNVGLMLVLSLPMFAASFRKRGLMPEKGVAFLFALPHLMLLTVAALGLFGLMIGWGLAGTFTGP